MGLNLRALALACLVVLMVVGPPARADGRLSPQGGTITAVAGATGGGLTGGGTGGPVYLSLLTTCSATQVLKWSGTAWACADVLGGAVAMTGIIRPAAVTGTIDDWAPTGLATASSIIVGTSGTTTLDGITGGTEGRILNLCNTGTFDLSLVNEAGGSTAANRFKLAGAATWILGSTGNSCATFLYDATAARWKMISKTGTSFPSLSINTSGVASTITTYHGANSDGTNIWIGGGGLNSVGDVVSTFFGSANTSNGAGALAADTTGYENTANGKKTLFANTTGHDNAGNGAFDLQANTVGSYETASGSLSLLVHVSGDGNTADGAGALQADTTGANDTAGGWFTLADLNITANDGRGNNTAYGANTGRGIVSGINNTILGANVTGLSSSLSGQIIIADGAGNKRIQVDSSAHTTLAGNVQIMATGATWTSGTGVPAISCAKGDEFSRTDGGVGSTHYNCTATNTWTAVSATTGTVTSVATGNGLTGGTITSTGTLSVNNGTGLIFSTGALTYDSSVIQSRVSGTCTGPNAITAIASGGTVTCSTGVATTTDVNTAVNGAAGQVAVYSAAHVLTGYTGFTSDSSGNVAIGGTLGVTGAATHSSTSHLVGAVTDDSTFTATQATIGGTSLAGARFNVILANDAESVGDVTAWDSRFATFGAATSTGLALGIAVNSTTGVITTALSPLSTFLLWTFNAKNYRWLINDGASMALDTSGNFSMNTNKFTIANASGNTAIAGTLNVTGAVTNSSTEHTVGAVTFDSTLGVAGLATLTGGFATSADGTINGNLTVTSRLVYKDAQMDQGTLYTLASGTTTNLKGATSGTFTASGTTETVSYGITFTTVPSCWISTEGTTKSYGYTRTTTQLSLTSLTNGQKYDWKCEGH